MPIKNRAPDQSSARATAMISPDSLALVRFGLRAHDDPRILNTIKVVDELLRAKLPQGPCWYRYNGDGYGEHKDGSPFDGTGIGRPGRCSPGNAPTTKFPRDALRCQALLGVMEGSAAGASRLIPEQVWDAADRPELELFRGKPTSSACPLVWAHSEISSCAARCAMARVFDQPPQTVQRYIVEKRRCQYFFWIFNNKARTMPCGKTLRIALLSPATIHWSMDGWTTSLDTHTRDTRLGVHVADLPTDKVPVSHEIVFTFKWDQDARWEGIELHGGRRVVRSVRGRNYPVYSNSTTVQSSPSGVPAQNIDTDAKISSSVGLFAATSSKRSLS